MIVAIMSRYSFDYNGEKIIIESCGTDAVYKPDNRKTLRNMILDTYEYLRRIKQVNRYDLMRLHYVHSYREWTDGSNAVTEYIKLDYDVNPHL